MQFTGRVKSPERRAPSPGGGPPSVLGDPVGEGHETGVGAGRHRHRFEVRPGTRGRRPRRGGGASGAAPVARRPASPRPRRRSTSRSARRSGAVGHRRGHPEVARVGRDQPRQHHPVEPGQSGQRPRTRGPPRSAGGHDDPGPTSGTSMPSSAASSAAAAGDGPVRASGSTPARTGSRSANSSACQAWRMLWRVEAAPAPRPAGGPAPTRRGWRTGPSRSIGTRRRVRPSCRAGATGRPRRRPRRR